MTDYDLRALDGADPSYAPNVTKSKNLFYWRPPARAVKAGYQSYSVRLPGRDGDGNELERARIAREHTRDMLRFMGGDDAPKVKHGTWGWLIARYLSDDLSPFNEVGPNAKADYRFGLGRWREVIGESHIADAGFLEIRRWLDGMKRNGRSTSYIHRLFRHLRVVVSYGVLIEADGCARVKEILGEMRIKASRPRTSAPTAEQVLSIIAEADRSGEHSFALGILLQWHLALRPADVRGQWLRMEKDDAGAGIVRGGFRWTDGLTWDNINLDAGIISKTPSKTADDMPEEILFEVSGIPEVMSRLSAVKKEDRIGPLIKARSGMPYGKDEWGKLFRQFRASLDLPKTFQCRDIRAAAINDAKRAGASPVQMMHQANHASLDTTKRYLREVSQDANAVIRLRARTASQQT